MTISYQLVDPNPSRTSHTHPISHLYLNSHTFKFFKEQAEPYIANNPGAKLSTFLDALPLLPDQEFIPVPNRPMRTYPATTPRSIQLSLQSVEAYHHAASNLGIGGQSFLPILLSNIAYGAIYPALYPTIYDQPSMHSRLTLSMEALHNLQIKTEPYSNSLYEAISRYLVLLSDQDIQLLYTRPNKVRLEFAHDFLDVDGVPPPPTRTTNLVIKLPILYLVNQANIHGVRAYRGKTDLSKAGTVVEYIGLGWLTPEHEPIIA